MPRCLLTRFSIPRRTVAAIAAARAAGGRVIAAGTSVVRALEGRALEQAGVLTAGEGSTALRLGPGDGSSVVDGLLTGMHDPSESHYALLQAFAPRELLERAFTRAEAWGYAGHEFGDACLMDREAARGAGSDTQRVAHPQRARSCGELPLL